MFKLVLWPFIATQVIAWALWKFFDDFLLFESHKLNDFFKILSITAPTFGCMWILFSKIDKANRKNIELVKASILGEINIANIEKDFKVNNQIKNNFNTNYIQFLKCAYRTNLLLDKEKDNYSIEAEKTFIQSHLQEINPDITVKEIDAYIKLSYPI